MAKRVEQILKKEGKVDAVRDKAGLAVEAKVLGAKVAKGSVLGTCP